jgi:outer membrane lipoprotein SlyB
MNKGIMSLFIIIFGTIGAYIPVWIFHQDDFSIASILGSGIGGIFGIWAAYKLSNSL